MTATRTLVALSAITLLSACAAPGPMNAAHETSAASARSSGNGIAPATSMEPRMKAMQDMRQKMMNAKTPAERHAFMADHMKAMQGGMAMMKEMHAAQGAGGMSGMAGMFGLPADMAKRHEMMTDHMATMDMMMQMMMDRLLGAPVN